MNSTYLNWSIGCDTGSGQPQAAVVTRAKTVPAGLRVGSGVSDHMTPLIPCSSTPANTLASKCKRVGFPLFSNRHPLPRSKCETEGVSVCFSPRQPVPLTANARPTRHLATRAGKGGWKAGNDVFILPLMLACTNPNGRLYILLWNIFSQTSLTLIRCDVPAGNPSAHPNRTYLSSFILSCSSSNWSL